MSGTNFPNGIKTRDANGVDKTITGNTAVASVASADGVAAAGATPTKAEYDVVVALVNELKAQVNALLVQLRNAYIIKP